MTSAGQFGPYPFIDSRGNALPGVELRVYDPTGTTLATLYVDSARSDELTNPIPTGVADGVPGVDTAGNAILYADAGEYLMVVRYHGAERYRAPITISADPADANAVLSVNGRSGIVVGLAEDADLDTEVAARQAHEADSTNVHGIVDTAALETQTGAQTKATAARDAAIAAAAALVDDGSGVTDPAAFRAAIGAQVAGTSVELTGDQTIDGVKDFLEAPTVNGVAIGAGDFVPLTATDGSSAVLADDGIFTVTGKTTGTSGPQLQLRGPSSTHRNSIFFYDDNATNLAQQVASRGAWASSTLYNEGDSVSANGHTWNAMSSGGTSGGTAPAWASATTRGQQVVDGTVTWELWDTFPNFQAAIVVHARPIPGIGNQSPHHHMGFYYANSSGNSTERLTIPYGADVVEAQWSNINHNFGGFDLDDVGEVTADRVNVVGELDMVGFGSGATQTYAKHQWVTDGAITRGDLMVIEPTQASRLQLSQIATPTLQIVGIADADAPTGGTIKIAAWFGMHQVNCDSGAVAIGDPLGPSLTTDGKLRANGRGPYIGFALTAKAAGSAGSVYAYLAPRVGPTPLAPGYITGQWYGPIGAVSTTRGFSANDLRLVPFFVREPQTFDRIGIEVSTAGGANTVFRLGIFNHDPTRGLPGTVLLDAGTVVGDSLGAQTKTISQALPVGWVWLAAAAQAASGSPALRAIAGFASSPCDMSPTSGAAMCISGAPLHTASGAFATLTGTPSVTTTAPAIILRAA